MLQKENSKFFNPDFFAQEFVTLLVQTAFPGFVVNNIVPWTFHLNDEVFDYREACFYVGYFYCKSTEAYFRGKVVPNYNVSGQWIVFDDVFPGGSVDVAHFIGWKISGDNPVTTGSGAPPVFITPPDIDPSNLVLFYDSFQQLIAARYPNSLDPSIYSFDFSAIFDVPADDVNTGASGNHSATPSVVLRWIANDGTVTLGNPYTINNGAQDILPYLYNFNLGSRSTVNFTVIKTFEILTANLQTGSLGSFVNGGSLPSWLGVYNAGFTAQRSFTASASAVKLTIKQDGFTCPFPVYLIFY